MKNWICAVLGILLLLAACEAKSTPVTIIVDGQVHTLNTFQLVPADIFAAAGIVVGPDDRILYLGASVAIDKALPDKESYTLNIRRAVALILVGPDGKRTIQTSATTVGQALTETGLTLYAGDLIDPPIDTPITHAMTVTYRPGEEITISVDGTQIRVRSAAKTVGQALAETGIPLVGLDYSLPEESAQLPKDGAIRIVRVSESITMTEKTIPFNTRSEQSAELEIDQQAMLQNGEAGLAVTRLRSRSEDNVQVSQQTESESVVRPPQDRIMGIGTKIVIHTATVDGQTFEYYRAVRMYTTSYSPCRSASPDGRCLFGTTSGLPVQQGTVAMVYSWYLAFGF
ncbi:MAG: ubiquitin-like domain-containing protein, partial [Anaerolineales bacterium]